MIQRSVRLCSVLALVVLANQADPASAVDTTFVLDEQQSSLTIEASTIFGIPLMDSDTQMLGGTVDATLDFGTSGIFPSIADLTVNGAAISPLNPFSLTLGAPPALGVSVTVTGAVADVQTPNPPVQLDLLPTALVRYSFDASGFDILLDQGTVVASGVINETTDLATSPVTGTADPGTLGELTFLNINTVGPITQIDAQLELPIMFTEVIDVDGQTVTLDVSGNVVANGSFNVALSGLPGDFDDDDDVDADDLAQWLVDYGGPGSDADGDGISDGDDFVIWQQNNGFGLQPLAASQAVPEPTSLSLLLFASLSFVLRSASRLS